MNVMKVLNDRSMNKEMAYVTDLLCMYFEDCKMTDFEMQKFCIRYSQNPNPSSVMTIAERIALPMENVTSRSIAKYLPDILSYVVKKLDEETGTKNGKRAESEVYAMAEMS